MASSKSFIKSSYSVEGRFRIPSTFKKQSFFRHGSLYGFSRSSLSSPTQGSSSSKYSEDHLVEKEPPVLNGDLRIIRKNLMSAEPMCCDVSKNQMPSNLLAVGLSDGSVEIRDVKNGNLISTVTDQKVKELPIVFVSFVEDRTKDDALLLCSGSSGLTDMVDLKSFKTLWTVTEDRTTLVNCVSPDIQKFALGRSDGKINIYDMHSQKLIRTLEKSKDVEKMDGHTMRVFALKYHPSNPFELVSGGWDNTVQFWDDRQPHAARKIFGPHICGEGIEFNEDGQSILTASWAKHESLQVWDYRKGNRVRDIIPDDYTTFLYCCQWMTENKMILTGGGNNNMLRAVDCRSWMTVGSYRNLAGAVYCLRVMSISVQESRMIFCIGFSNELYVMELLL